MQLFELIKEEDIILGLEHRDKESTIKKMVSVLAKNKAIRNIKKLQQEVIDRENVGTTAIGKGLAVPHVKTNLVKGIFGCIAYFPEGVDFKSLDDKKTKVVLLVIASIDYANQYLEVMSQATKKLGDIQSQRVMFLSSDKKKILEVLKKVCN